MMTQGSLPEGTTTGGLIMAMIAVESAGVRVVIRPDKDKKRDEEDMARRAAGRGSGSGLVFLWSADAAHGCGECRQIATA